MKPSDRESLLYDWNHEVPLAELQTTVVEFDDETLRDGLQSPSARHPSLNDKIRLVHLMEALGIHTANIGLPGAGGNSIAHITRLAQEMTGLAIRPNVACRTLLSDIKPVVDMVQSIGEPIEVCTFIGSSSVRQYVEGWEFDEIVRLSRDAVRFCSEQQLPCLFVTEDTTRANPENLRTLYRTAIEAGAQRICIADTVGHATPEGVRRLIAFVRGVIDEVGVPVGIDWHGHRDRGLALANALAAIDAGATRIHGTALGIGERVGNTAMDLLLVNLRMRGVIDNDLSRLAEYCDFASRAIGIPLPYNYPVFGKDAFETATGVHAAAVIKAFKKNDTWLANRVYSGVPAEMVGLAQGISVGPMSGRSNVVYVLEKHGVKATKHAVRNVLLLAKQTSRLLTVEEILAAAGAAEEFESEEQVVRATPAQDSLQIHSELYRQVFDDSSDAIIIADARDGYVQHANSAALSLYGYSSEQLGSLQVDDLCATPSPHEAERFPVPLLQLHTTASGVHIPVDVSISHIAVDARERSLMVLMVRDVSEREAYEQRLSYLSRHDVMTDLLNQPAFDAALQRSLDRLNRSSSALGVAVLNLDRFRSVNDSFGHDIGDLVIRRISEKLRHCLRDSDSVSRSGGDEFAFLLKNAGDTPDIAKICERVLGLVAEPILVNGESVYVTGSIGISVRAAGTPDCAGQDLSREATTAMQRVRDNGGNGLRFFAVETDRVVQHRRALEVSLREALQLEQFVLHYQPQLDLRDASMSMEALLRWQHPEHGLVPPLDFIGTLEETGLIVPVGRWVLKTAIQQLREWKFARTPASRIAVNVSAREIDADWLCFVRDTLTEAGIAGCDLTLEITESVLLESDEARRDVLETLDGLGVCISLDDFGTGYSSLSYLKRLPIRELKIDRSFIADIATNADSNAIVDAILSLSQSLELPVVVEGVETSGQLEVLRKKGCTCIQGYLLGRPMAQEVAQRWFEKREWRALLAPSDAML
tara:strand:+ start:13811 stop:16774 length:2964 start_codon:yes stop_codon:yes gene_type:complete